MFLNGYGYGYKGNKEKYRSFLLFFLIRAYISTKNFSLVGRVYRVEGAIGVILPKEPILREECPALERVTSKSSANPILGNTNLLFLNCVLIPAQDWFPESISEKTNINKIKS